MRDAEALADLVIELQQFHHLPQQSRDEICRDIRQMPSAFEVWIAENGGSSRQLCGFALVSVYPGPGIAAGFYLKELFVTGAARKSGVGRSLMKALALSAVERGFRRMDWVTTYDNTEARALYDRVGAQPNPAKLFYRLEEDGLHRLSQS